jgi:hypothetical protein
MSSKSLVEYSDRMNRRKFMLLTAYVGQEKSLKINYLIFYLKTLAKISERSM